MLYLLPNPGGYKPRRKKKATKRKSGRGTVARKGPGLPISFRPSVWRPAARRSHPPSKTVGGRKIQKAMGKGKFYRHRIVFWSKHPRGGDEGIRTPYYVKGNSMARRTRARRRRKYGRRRRNPIVRSHRRRSPRRRARSRRRRNVFYALGNPRRRRRRRSRRNPGYALGNPRRRRRSRRRRNPLVLGNAPRRRRRSRRRISGRRRRRGFARRNPSMAGAIRQPLALLRPRTFMAQAQGFAMTAVPVGMGFVGARLLDQYAFTPLHGRLLGNFLADKSEVVNKIVNTIYDTFTALVLAGVGGGIVSRFWRRQDTAKLFAAGVAVHWIKKIAVIWLPEGQIKAALAGSDDELSDYVEASGMNGLGYGHQDSMGDYVESSPGMNDYVEASA